MFGYKQVIQNSDMIGIRGFEKNGIRK